jgi:hypothetical protein
MFFPELGICFCVWENPEYYYEGIAENTNQKRATSFRFSMRGVSRLGIA